MFIGTLTSDLNTTKFGQVFFNIEKLYLRINVIKMIKKNC